MIGVTVDRDDLLAVMALLDDDRLQQVPSPLLLDALVVAAGGG